MNDSGAFGRHVRDERPRDRDETVIMPAYRPNDETQVLPIIGAEGPVSWDAGAVTAEFAVVPPRSDDTGAAVARHGTMLAVASIVSRVTGFLRTAAIGAAIGGGLIGDDYTLANVLPGMVYEFLLGGVLASVVIPLIVRARARDADRGEAYVQRLLTLAIIFLAGATIVAVLCAPLFTALYADDKTSAADRSVITTLAYMMLPMIFFYGLAALFMAILNTRDHFAAPAWAPILNNIVVIAMAGLFALLPSVTHPTNAETISAAQITVLGLGTTLGIIIQAAGLLPALRRVGFRWRLRWDWRALGLSQLGRLGAWMLIYVIVSQIAVFVINKLAYSAANTAAAEGHGAPGPFIFNNAYLIFMMAHGVVAVSIITVLMPRMSAAAAENRHADLAYQISLGTRLVAVILIPVTAAYLVLGRPLAVTLFQWGNYHHAQALNTGWVIAVGGLGLVPFAISQVQLFAFYAMADTKTPALINVPVVALRIVVDLLFFVALPALWVATGLMGGNAISFVLGVVLGYMWLRRYVGDLGLRQVFGTMSKLAVAAAVAALPALLVVVVLVNVWNDGKIASIVELIAGSIVLAVVYIVVALALRVREVRELGTMLKARLGR